MRKTFNAWPKAILILCALGALSACSVLPETPSRDNYRLPVSSFAAPAQTPVPVDWSLRVVTPHSGRLLDGMGILVIRHDNQINVYKGAQWADSPPVMVRDRILDAFRADARVQSISHERSFMAPDLELRSDLRGFQVEYHEDRPYVHMQLDATLIISATRSIVSTRSFSVALPANGEQVPEVVQTFGIASDQLAQEVISWTIRQTASNKGLFR